MLPETTNVIRRLVINRRFEYAAMAVIIFNSVLIGVETYFTSPVLHYLNYACLVLFTIELWLRFMARYSNKEFFQNRWNLFDMVIIFAGYIPPSFVADNAVLIEVLRLIRILRVLRLLRTMEELRLIVTVLIRSLRTLTYNLIVMFIFLYMFAITGIYLFRLPNPDTATPEQQAAFAQLQEIASWPSELEDDPYGNLSEALFTLVRCMSGDGWSDIRNNLCVASRLGLIRASEVTVTSFHIVWYILAAFLLINIIIGAVLNNFETTMRQKEQDKQKRELQQEIERELAKKQERLAHLHSDKESDHSDR